MFKSIAISALLVATASSIKLQSDPICSSAGCDQYLHPGKPRGYDIDYFVPNFGADTDVVGTKDSAAVAEK